jgi:hypothetical protein
MAGPRWEPHTPSFPASLDGVSIHIEGEQGIGDEIFFLRFLPKLKALGARLSFRPNNAKTKELIGRPAWLDQVLSPSDKVSPAVWSCMLGDVPHLLGMKSFSDVPPPLPLTVDPIRIDKIREKLGATSMAPLIGLTWRAGSPPNERLPRSAFESYFKQIPLDLIIDVLSSIEATVVVIQRVPLPEEMQKLQKCFGSRLIDCSYFNDSMHDMLSLLFLLDDMIGVSNTNFHLRASLSKSSRVLVEKTPEFRWLDSGTYSPWFPKTTIYRESGEQRWKPALDQLSLDLANEFAVRIN